MDSRHEFTIKIDGEKWEKAINDAYVKNNKKAKIDGFRPGKAPMDVFIKHYGKETLYADAAESLVSEAYNEVIKRENVTPVVMPSVELLSTDDTHVEFKFIVITAPKVEIKKYKDLKVKKDDVSVSKEEIENEMNSLLKSYSELVVKDGEASNGDIVVIDFEGFKDGKPFEGGKGENHSLELGSHSFIPGFEEQLVGLKSGDEKEIEVTFPEDYFSEELKGKKVTFKVIVHEVKEKKLPEFTEEFFKDLDMEGVNSKESLEENIKNHLSKHKEEAAEEKYVNDLLEAISKNTKVDIPDEMVDDEIHHLIERMDENLKHQGMSLELYLQFTKTNMDDLHKQLEPEAYKNVLYRLILDELLKVEKVEVSDQEMDEEASKLALKYNMEKDKIVEEFGGLQYVKYELEMRKLFDKLKEYNK